MTFQVSAKVNEKILKPTNLPNKNVANSLDNKSLFNPVIIMNYIFNKLVRQFCRLH